MGLFNFEYSEDYKLKKQIEIIVSNWENNGYTTVTGSGVTIEYDKFYIRLESNGNMDRVYSGFIKFNGKPLYTKDDGRDSEFLLELCKIVYKKERVIESKRIEKQKEKEKLERSLLISEALASITGLNLTKVSEEVKDEFDPIFTKVKRVVEITKELEGIRKEFAIV